MIAVRLGKLDITRKLLSVTGIDVNKQDIDGHAALSIAAANGYDEIVQTLLEKEGIKVNLTTHVARYSALAFAALNITNDSSTIRSLLAHGADPNIRDNNRGGTAISNAIKSGFTSAVEALLEHDIELQAVDNDGQGLLHYASAVGNARLIHVLNGLGLPLNCKDKTGSTPLHEASRHGKIEAAKALLELGA